RIVTSRLSNPRAVGQRFRIGRDSRHSRAWRARLHLAPFRQLGTRSARPGLPPDTLTTIGSASMIIRRMEENLPRRGDWPHEVGCATPYRSVSHGSMSSVPSAEAQIGAPR